MHNQEEMVPQSMLFGVGFICICVGVALTLLCQSDFGLSGIIIFIVLGCIIGTIRKAMETQEGAMSITRAQETKEQANLIKQQRDTEIHQMRMEQHIAKAQTKNFNFTSDDFDDISQSMLLPLVKEARKKKLRVTGEGLVSTFLKGIR